MMDVLIESLVKIGNHPKVIKMCEPNIIWPQELQSWMVVRVIKAQELLQKEWDKR